VLMKYCGDQLVQPVTLIVVRDDDLGKGPKVAENVVLEKKCATLRIFMMTFHVMGDR
jgi:hypothetical protein